MRTRIVTVFGLLVLVALPAFAQLSGGSSKLGPNGQLTVTTNFGGLPLYPPSPIIGAPYSGVETNQHIQTLADGTRITQDGPSSRLYRDSAGRTRTDRQFPAVPPSVKNAPLFVEITDPVAGYRIVLDTVNKVAHRSALQQVPTRPPVTPSSLPPSNIARPDISIHHLGTKTIEGLLLDGTQTSMTYPVGAMGNDRPLVTTSESWMSTELRIVVFSKTTDPRTGDFIKALTNVSRVDPDAALFQVPGGYQLIEEAGPFLITFTLPAQ